MALLEIDNDMVRDGRFDELGMLTGRGKYDARGRVENLWLDCIDETLDVRSTEEIDNLTGWFEIERGHFADLLVKTRLAEKVAEGGYRIRGVRERMAWLIEIREKRAAVAAAGGAARAKGARRGEGGRFTPAEHQPQAGDNQLQAGVHQPQPALPVPGSYSASASPSGAGPTKENTGASVPQEVTAEGVQACKEAWLETLRFFKSGRGLMPTEEMLIAKAIQHWKHRAVELALIGMRFEPSGKDYDPGKNLSLARVLPLELRLPSGKLDEQGRESKFGRFLNLGTQAYQAGKVQVSWESQP